DNHYYQPLWTLVGAGVSSLISYRKDMEIVIPEGALWIKQAVSSFQPEYNSVILGVNTVVYFDFLVVAPGLHINWSS
ncbi:pyridine nucleotide-disulfide oxidoreductase, partial [Staphylococcus aureus]|nr:pyridine nucleotide-disulfide oxidoreductase [Staphylococcus aureus]